MTIALSVIVGAITVYLVYALLNPEVLIRGIIHYDLGCSRYYNAVVYSCGKANGNLFRKAFQGNKS